MARVYETVTVLCLLGGMVLGMTYVLSALLDYQKSNLYTLLSKYIVHGYMDNYKIKQEYRHERDKFVFQIYGVTICLSCIPASRLSA